MSPSRTASIVTHLRCNQACVWCTRRAAEDDPRFIRADAVRARIDAALAEGARELVLTGGEPTMRADLGTLVSHARAAGAERIVVETNATLVDEAGARGLVEAGVDVVRVNVPAWDDAYDVLTQDPGGFARARSGVRALAEAGLAIEAAVTLTRSTVAHLPAIPGALRAAVGPALRAIVVAFPVDAPDERELLSLEQASRGVLALERSARPLGLTLRMSPGDPLPPCAFEPRELPRVARLYTMTPGAPARPGWSHVPACDACTLRDRCPGLATSYLDRAGVPPAHPVDDDRMRRRLALASSVDEQVARELVSRNPFTDDTGRTGIDETIRVVFRCNQSCTFCFVSTHLPAPAPQEVERAIRAAGARGARIVLSGGEPTLAPGLVEWVRLARSVSPHMVVLQTNAVRLDDADLVARLVSAGLGEAFVSLHGATAATSDAVTEAPGTYARTLVGIDRLHASGVRVVLNYVVCERNHHELVDHVRAIAARWRSASLNVSFVAPSSDVVPRDRALVPRYSDVLPSIAEAVAEARRLVVPVVGFESMCGLPLCLVPPGVPIAREAPLPEGFDQGEFVKTEECGRCALRTRCWGLRRGYAEMHGTGELRAIEAAETGGVTV